jgi:hypothetical protein
MKLKINNKLQEVGFWSFLKCNLLVSLALTGMVYGVLIVLGIVFAVAFNSVI